MLKKYLGGNLDSTKVKKLQKNLTNFNGLSKRKE